MTYMTHHVFSPSQSFNLLGQCLWFDEDIEVSLFQLFSYHLKNFWSKTEVSQVVNEKLKQQLE